MKIRIKLKNGFRMEIEATEEQIKSGGIQNPEQYDEQYQAFINKKLKGKYEIIKDKKQPEQPQADQKRKV